MNFQLLRKMFIIASATFAFATEVHALGTTILEGDVYIEIMATVFTTLHENGTCSDVDIQSVQNVEAVKWTLENLNRNIKSYLPAFSKGIGLRLSATCGSTAIGEDLALQLATELENNTRQDIVGLMGPGFSPATQSVSGLIGSLPAKYRLLQMDYSATSTSLNNRDFYKNLVTTVPSDDLQIKIIQPLLKTLRWTNVAIVNEDSEQGRRSRDAILDQIKSRDICFPLQITVPSNETNEEYLNTALSTTFTNASVPVHGAIVIGSREFSANIMKAVEKYTGKTMPLFLFSETGASSDFFDKVSVQGSYTISPPRKEIQQFQDHWKQVIRNQSPGGIFMKPIVAGPSQGTSIVNVYGANVEPSLYNQYAIQAGLIIAKVVKQVYKSVCESPEQCENIFTTTRQTFTDTLAGLTVDFDVDFDGVRIRAFQEPDLVITFDNNRKMTRSPEIPLYEAYNFQKCDNDRSKTCTKKIAELKSNGELVSTLNDIRDYSADGAERKWPDVRKAQCPPGIICDTCLSLTQSQDRVLFEPGDMYVVGIVPVHNPGENPLKCGDIKSGGVDIVEGIRFAIRDAKNSIADRIPDGSIGVVIIDSCNDAHIIQEKVLNLHRFGVLHNGEYIAIADKIIGYIGGWSSDVSTAVVSITTRLGLVQIAYASTAPTLSSQSLYPYFLRTPSPDNKQADTLLRLVKLFKSNFIQILYSETAYGEGGRDIIVSLSKHMSVCIAHMIGVKRTSNSTDIARALRKHNDAKVVVCFLGSFEIEPLVKSLNDNLGNHGFIFISSEGWGTRVDISNYRNLAGSITLTSELPINQKYKDHLKGMGPSDVDVNPWIREYLEKYFACYYEWSYDKHQGDTCSGSKRLDVFTTDYSVDVWVSFTERAVLALLQGTKIALDELCGGSTAVCKDFYSHPEVVFNATKRITFKDEGGTTRSRVFDDKGDGLAGYKIYVVDENGKYKRIGLSDSSTFTFDVSIYPGNIDKQSACTGLDVCNGCFSKSPQTNGEDMPVVWIAVTACLVAILLVLLAFLIFLYRRLGCCITIDEGRPRINDAYITPLHMRSASSRRGQQVGTEMDYDSIRESYRISSSANDYVIGNHHIASTKRKPSS